MTTDKWQNDVGIAIFFQSRDEKSSAGGRAVASGYINRFDERTIYIYIYI